MATTMAKTCKCGKYILSYKPVRDLACGMDHYKDVCRTTAESIAMCAKEQNNNWYDTNGRLASNELAGSPNLAGEVPGQPLSTHCKCGRWPLQWSSFVCIGDAGLPISIHTHSGCVEGSTMQPMQPVMVVKPETGEAERTLARKLAETEKLLLETQERCRALEAFGVKMRNGQVEKSRRLTLKPLPGCTTEVQGLPGSYGKLDGREYTLDFGKEMDHLILLNIPYRPDGRQHEREAAATATMMDLHQAYPAKKIVLIRTLPGFEVTVCEITR